MCLVGPLGRIHAALRQSLGKPQIVSHLAHQIAELCLLESDCDPFSPLYPIVLRFPAILGTTNAIWVAKPAVSRNLAHLEGGGFEDTLFNAATRQHKNQVGRL